MAGGTLRLTLPAARRASLLRPRDDHPGGYRFFKPVLRFRAVS